MSACLIVGQGSIGQRHARILSDLEHSVKTVSRRSGIGDFEDIPNALEGALPDYVVIASETSQHYGDLAALAEAGYSGRVLVEKPLFAADRPMPDNRFSSVHVGYQLRFHPLITALRSHLDGQTCLSVDLRVGQHLSTWRPGRDHRQSYSADPQKGGGVLRDLSHELDLALWLFGGVRDISARITHSGTLGIEAEDTVRFTASFTNCPAVSGYLSYLDHLPVRQIRVTTAERSYNADLLAGRLEISGAEPMEVSCDKDDAYRALHRAVLTGEDDIACSLGEGCAVMELIETIEAAGAAG